jgi:hypothetical protein
MKERDQLGDVGRDGTIMLYWSKLYRRVGSMQLIQYGV